VRASGIRRCIFLQAGVRVRIAADRHGMQRSHCVLEVNITYARISDMQPLFFRGGMRLMHG